MNFESIINAINDIIWSNALIGVCLAAGLYFSVLTRFVQVRMFKDMIRLLFNSKDTEKAGVSSFQAFAMGISGRVGTGNIVGVATAISMGGPGAIFWMWLIAFLGAGSAFVESTLAQIYKTEQNGELRGGPSYYIEKGLKLKWFAVVFAVAALVGTGFLLPTVQSNAIGSALQNAFGIELLYVAIGLTTIVALVIVGGIGRLAKVAELVAPFMAILYILCAVAVIISNIEKVPETFGLIFRSAFGLDSVLGAVFGSAVAWGVKRGVYSNEAGQGTGAIVAGAAEVSHPAKQGLVQAFSIYIDTIVICTATALMILLTDSYNVVAPDGNGFLVEKNALVGGNANLYTQAAVDTLLPGYGNKFIGIAIFFFAFTTIIAYYYYAETSISYLLKKYNKEKIGIWVLRIGMLTMIFNGVLNTSKLSWTMGDIGVGIMAWCNLIAILMLHKKALIALKNYSDQTKVSKDPVFNPKELGIENATYWEDRK